MLDRVTPIVSPPLLFGVDGPLLLGGDGIIDKISLSENSELNLGGRALKYLLSNWSGHVLT